MPGPDPEITAVDILAVFVNSPEPAFVASEVADELDVTLQGARHQMENLVDDGYLKRKKPGRSTVLYWLTPEGHAYYQEKQQQS